MRHAKVSQIEAKNQSTTNIQNPTLIYNLTTEIPYSGLTIEACESFKLILSFPSSTTQIEAKIKIKITDII